MHRFVPRSTLRLCTIVDMSTSAITLARVSRPGTLHINTCTTRAICTFLRHECSHALHSRPTSSGLEPSVSRSEARYPTPLRDAPYTSRVNFTAQCLAGPTILFDNFRLVYALAQAFPADYFTAGIYTRPNSAEASAQINRLEHVLRPPGTGWSLSNAPLQKETPSS